MNSMNHSSKLQFRFVWPDIFLAKYIGQPTALILVADCLDDFERTMITSRRAIFLAKNCVDMISLIGEDSERSHDSLDQLLEESGIYNVVTTYHASNEMEDAAALVVASAQANCFRQILVVMNPSTALGIRMRVCLEECLPSTDLSEN